MSYTIVVEAKQIYMQGAIFGAGNGSAVIRQMTSFVVLVQANTVTVTISRILEILSILQFSFSDIIGLICLPLLRSKCCYEDPPPTATQILNSRVSLIQYI